MVSGPLPERQRRDERGDDEDEDDDMEEDDPEMEYEPTEPDIAVAEAYQDRNFVDDIFAADPEDGSGPKGESAEEEVIDKEVEFMKYSKHEDPFVCSPSGDSREPVIIRSPIMPSAEDIKTHYATHLPYRSWCPVCVKAKCKEDGHFRIKERDKNKDGLTIISLDYQDLNEESKIAQKIIVGKDETTGMLLAHFIKCKGTGDEWLMRQLVRDIEEFGRSDVILKTDGEPAIVALQSRIQSMRKASTVPRHPPAYNPQSNGPCEKAVQDVTAHMRALIIGLEARLQAQLGEDSAIRQWALEHAVFLLNHFNVGSDGMTPIERVMRRKWRRPIVEIGEMVLAKLALRRQQKGKVKKQKRKLAPRCIEAVWVGQIARSGEHIVIKANGDAVRCRTIKRVPEQHRWNAEKIRQIRGTPRCPAPSTQSPDRLESRLVDEEADAVQRHRQVRAEPTETAERTESGARLEMPEGSVAEVISRELRITDQVLQEFGFTDDCEGCERKRAGNRGKAIGQRAHSAACRQRIYEEMSKDERGKDKLEAVKKRLASRQRSTEDTPKDAGEASKIDNDPIDQCPGTPTDDNLELPQNSEGMNPTVGDIAEIQELEEDGDASMADEDVNDPLRCLKRDFDEQSDDDLDDADKENDAKRRRLKLINAMKPNASEDNAPLANLNMARESYIVKKIMRDLDKNNKSRYRDSENMQTYSANQVSSMDVGEVYPPPRISKMAENLGMKAGWSFDLTCVDEEDGEVWDFSNESKKKKARERLDRDKPFLLVASPMCKAFSRLIAFSKYQKMEHAEVVKSIQEAIQHLKFSLELCLRQHAAGRLFVFEHPDAALSWAVGILKTVMTVDGVHRINFDCCSREMKTKFGDKANMVSKQRKAVFTNSDAIATLLREAQCRGEHRHQQSQTEMFCRLICEGVKREFSTIRWRNQLQKVLDISKPFGLLMAAQRRLEALATPPEEDPFDALYRDKEFVDDISGVPLVKAMAIAARKAEMEYFRKMKVYSKVKRERWMRPIASKWLDINKGDEDSPNYRARLVGCEIKKDKREDLFAATPPLESLRMLASICASNQHHVDPSKRYIIMSNDVKRAYFYAPSTRPVHILIPQEDWEDGDEERVGVLHLSLYGTRDAALNWANTYTKLLKDIGFITGTASPCNFRHATRSIAVTVHGDDFSSTGTEADLKWLDAQLKSKFDIKTEFLGPEKRHSKQLRILNRIISWGGDGITYEADQRHAEILVKEMGVKNAVLTPGSRDDAGKAGPPNVEATKVTVVPEFHGKRAMYKLNTNVCQELKFEDFGDNLADGDSYLAKHEASRFRALAARANYLAQDRPDIQYSVKEVARRMCRPRQSDWVLLKRLARYLVGAPRALLKYYWQKSPTCLDVFVDADWAGCKSTCRSTSGGAARHGWHTVKTWSTTQATVAMSSGESELYSLNKGAAQALGLMALAMDFGIELEARVHTDASATLGVINRKGLGRLRHINVQYLWLQDRAKQGDLKVSKVDGYNNPADLMTKHLSSSDMLRHTKALGLEFINGRAELAPQLAQMNRKVLRQWSRICYRERLDQQENCAP